MLVKFGTFGGLGDRDQKNRDRHTAIHNFIEFGVIRGIYMNKKADLGNFSPEYAITLS